jgi:hypothetical protein
MRKRREFEWLLWFVVFGLNAMGLFHELGHALAALSSGYQVYGISLFAWGPLGLGADVELSATNTFVSFAGGVAQVVVLAFLMLALIRLYRPNTASIWNSVWNGGRAKNSEFYFVLVYLLICSSLFCFGYAIFEVIV